MRTVRTLYALMSLVTGLLHSFYFLLEMANGTVNPLNAIGLLGSSMLVATAFIVMFRQQFAGKFGLVGSVLVWVYYASLVSLVVQLGWSELESRGVGLLVAPSLLVVCTASSIFLFRKSSGPQKGSLTTTA